MSDFEHELYIYQAIINGEQELSGPNFKWNSTKQVYEYSNTLFPNKKYKKEFNPKSFMTRGQVIHFGNDDYRNNNKMIFNGEKLEHLYFKIDDYGSVPPEYVVGDKDGEFNIGDFRNTIDHNNINWLSSDKLKEIELYVKDNEIKGKVIIRGKEWKINFFIGENVEYSQSSYDNNNDIKKCILENDNIIIYKNTNFYNKFVVCAEDEIDKDKLLNLIQTNNINTLKCNDKYNSWFLFHEIKEYKFTDYDKNNQNFPIVIIDKRDYLYYSMLILNKIEYDKYISYNNITDLDNYIIIDIIGYRVNIKLVKKDINTYIDDIKKFINKIDKSYFVHHNEKDSYDDSDNDDDNTLNMYI